MPTLTVKNVQAAVRVYRSALQVLSITCTCELTQILFHSGFIARFIAK